jgi:hypothetical protein
MMNLLNELLRDRAVRLVTTRKLGAHRSRTKMKSPSGKTNRRTADPDDDRLAGADATRRLHAPLVEFRLGPAACAGTLHASR